MVDSVFSFVCESDAGVGDHPPRNFKTPFSSDEGTLSVKNAYKSIKFYELSTPWYANNKISKNSERIIAFLYSFMAHLQSINHRWNLITFMSRVFVYFALIPFCVRKNMKIHKTSNVYWNSYLNRTRPPWCPSHFGNILRGRPTHFLCVSVSKLYDPSGRLHSQYNGPIRC